MSKPKETTVDILDEFYEGKDEVVEEVSIPSPAPAKKTRTLKEAVKEVYEPIVIQSVDPAIAKRARDNERMQKADKEWRDRLAGERKLPFKAPKYYKELLSSFYAFDYNGTPVVVRFDGTTQYFPETIHKKVIEKLGFILDSHISQNEIDEL